MSITKDWIITLFHPVKALFVNHPASEVVSKYENVVNQNLHREDVLNGEFPHQVSNIANSVLSIKYLSVIPL